MGARFQELRGAHRHVSRCSHIKLEMLPLDARHSLLHPYLDRLPARPWLAYPTSGANVRYSCQMAKSCQSATGPDPDADVHSAARRSSGEGGAPTHAGICLCYKALLQSFATKAATKWQLRAYKCQTASKRDPRSASTGTPVVEGVGRSSGALFALLAA